MPSHRTSHRGPTHPPPTCATAFRVVFNEFGSVAGCPDLKLPTQFGRSGGILALQQRLEQRGYTFHVAECSFPSAIATRLPVEHAGTFPLDDTRAAVHVTVRPDQNDADAATAVTAVTVYATHLDHKDGELHSHFAPNGGCARPTEATELLRRVGMLSAAAAAAAAAATALAPAQAPASRVLVVGDFNQQRRRDYTPGEWKLICASKKRRGCAETDGVADLMAEAGFVCAFDAGGDRGTADGGSGGSSDGDGSAEAGGAGPICEGGGFEQRRGGGDTVAHNWAPGAPPPATHWTGTVIDLAFARGPVVPRGVFVVPSNLSDHRPVITDWAVS